MSMEMNQGIMEYAQVQAGNKQRFAKLQDFVAGIEKVGIPVDSDIKGKMAELSKGISENEKLRVVLIGGFSEGKTSIAAAWLGKEDSSMKISEQESSNEVKIYHDDYIDLVDTPGLYGFKEKINDDTGKIEKYQEITKKYVSNAHIVLYVMNASNPIKDSHSTDLKWLFRELNLLPRTIFVVGHFDTVADVEDEEEYNKVLVAKKKDIVKRLDDILCLTDAEKRDLKIVGVSADPFGEGREYWKQNAEEFKQLSKIDSLRKATKDIIDCNGRNALIVEEQKTVVQDVRSRYFPKLQELCDEGENTLKQSDEEIVQAEQELEDFEREARNAKISLQNSINEIFSNLYGEIEASNGADLKLFVDQKIGRDGSVLLAKIEGEIAAKTEVAELKINKISKDIETIKKDFMDYVSQTCNTVMSNAEMAGGGKFGSSLVNSVSGSIATSIAERSVVPVTVEELGLGFWTKLFTSNEELKAKAAAATATKIVGASNKIATGLNGVLAAVGSFFEWWMEKRNEEKIAQAKEEINKALREMQHNCLEKFSDDNEFIKNFFPQKFERENTLNVFKEGKQEIFERQSKLKELIKQGEIIDVEFQEL